MPSPEPSSFSLAQLVSDVYDDGIVDLEEMAEAVMVRLAPEHYEAAIRTMLREYLRQAIRKRRPNGPIGRAPSLTEYNTQLAELAGQQLAERQQERIANLPPLSEEERREQWVSPRMRQASTAAARLRERWLSARFRGVGGYKELRHFTIDDCLYASKYDRAMGNALFDRAEGMDNIRQALLDHGAHEVANLPEEIQDALFARPLAPSN